MNAITLVTLALLSTSAHAYEGYGQIELPDAGYVLTPTLPTSKLEDYDRPRIVVKPDGTAYQTLPSSNIRDWDKPGFKIDRHNVREWKLR
jgi:hypothetical protein